MSHDSKLSNLRRSPGDPGFTVRSDRSGWARRLKWGLHGLQTAGVPRELENHLVMKTHTLGVSVVSRKQVIGIIYLKYISYLFNICHII